MPLQGQALKTVARPQADEHPLETCGLHRGGVEAEAEAEAEARAAGGVGGSAALPAVPAFWTND